MVFIPISTLLPSIFCLFATSSNRRHNQNQSNNQNQNQSNSPIGSKNRRRHITQNSTPPPPSNNQRRRRRSNNRSNNRSTDGQTTRVNEEVYPLPSLTTTASSSSLRPTYFTCRHTYEDDLIAEIRRYSHLCAGAVYKVHPGLVKFDSSSVLSHTDTDTHTDVCRYLDPVYALQILPNCVVVEGDSIKDLARAVSHSLLGTIDGTNQQQHQHHQQQPHNTQMAFSQAPRGSLAVHALVPGMCKGQRRPLMRHRVEKITEEIVGMWKKRFVAARPIRSNNEEEETTSGEKWLLQVMLQTPTLAVASLVQCHSPSIPSTTTSSYSSSSPIRWPEWDRPLGLSNVDLPPNLVPHVPSSAYRKLLEALACMRRRPPPSSSLSSSSSSSSFPVVDLGASPGGWTSVLRLLNCRVIAVDRSPLSKEWMEDDGVEFVQGDAFAYRPPWWRFGEEAGEKEGEKQKTETEDSEKTLVQTLSPPPVGTWMVSDIVCYPSRTVSLLRTWLGNRSVENCVVTMKFQHGEKDPDSGANGAGTGTDGATSWEALEEALEVAKECGYKWVRARHFFNNKNEVTIMVMWDVNEGGDDGSGGSGNGSGGGMIGDEIVLDRCVYDAILPRR